MSDAVPVWMHGRPHDARMANDHGPRALTIAGREFTFSVRRVLPPAETAIVIPMHEQIEWTRLAVDAIRAFTPEPHEVWIVDNASAWRTRWRLRRLGRNVIWNRSSTWPWWSRPERWGSLANAAALELAARVVTAPWWMVMHNDALPVRRGWLTWLRAQAESGPGIATMHATAAGRPHASGTLLFHDRWRPGAFLPVNGHDVVEGIAADVPSARCRGYRCGLTDARWVPPAFLEGFDGDVSYDEEGRPLWLHLGGATMNQRRDTATLIATLRRRLGIA